MSDVQIGSEIGGYRLELLVGSGSFGSVWRARHIASNRVVALKVLTGTYSTGEVATSRAAIELLAASASAASPHVVKVLDGGVEPVPYVVMEYIEGRNLRARIDAEGPLGVEETLRIGHAVADALRVLNDARIIHRDVKPANVMITAQGVPKLTDFGIAKIVGYESVTLTGVPMSPAYTAPEAWEENRASHYSDLYALGILMYECLTGRPPFVGTYPQVYQAHLSREPDYDALPEKLPSLLELLRKCLAKDPADRPADAGVCLVLIEQALAEWRERYGAEVPPAGSEPRAFGPWLRQSPHPSLPDAWLCIHEQTAQGATVEVLSSDDVALGQALRRAVEGNATLVPLGAERLLGTNRLVLRPGEAWATPPAGQFQFWVAREDAVVEQGSRPLAPDALRQVATKVLELEAAAEAVGLPLGTGRLVLDDGQALSWSRPGLPPADEAVLTALDWLRQLPLDADAMEAAASAETVTELIDARQANSVSAAETEIIPLPVLEPEVAPGVAHLQKAQQEVEDGLATVQSLRIGDFGQRDEPLQPRDDGPDKTQADEESGQPWPDAGTTQSRGASRRKHLAFAIPLAAVMAVAAAAFFLIREGSGEASGGPAAAATAPSTVPIPTAPALLDTIAFASTDKGLVRIFLIQPDGSRRRRLTKVEDEQLDPSWSPDARLVAYSTGTSIRIVGADGSNPRTIVETGNQPYCPAWSPTGDLIAYLGYSHVGNDPGDDVFVVKPDGSDRRALTERRAFNTGGGCPSWSPDGNRLVYVSNRDNRGGFYIIDISQGNRITMIPLPANLYFPSSPAWAPDGSVILFVAQETTERDLYSIRPDGTGFTRVTRGERSIEQPFWASDGGRIGFTKDDGGIGGPSLYVMNIDGTDRRRLVSNPGAGRPAWSSFSLPPTHEPTPSVTPTPTPIPTLTPTLTPTATAPQPTANRSSTATPQPALQAPQDFAIFFINCSPCGPDGKDNLRIGFSWTPVFTISPNFAIYGFDQSRSKLFYAADIFDSRASQSVKYCDVIANNQLREDMIFVFRVLTVNGHVDSEPVLFHPDASIPCPIIQSASLLRIGPVTGGSGIVTVVIYNSDRSNSVGPIEITVAITRSGVTYSQTGTLTFDPFTGDPRDNGHNFQLARPPGAGVGTINVIYQGTVVTSAQDVLP